MKSLQSNGNKIKEHPYRILLVDDEPDVVVGFEICLEDHGFIVDSFNDPVLALSSFKQGLYSLALFDIKMPKLNGFELYREIRKIDDKVKICFLTAGGVPGKVRFDTPRGGYQDRFIRLPIENEVLIQQIGKIIIRS